MAIRDVVLIGDDRLRRVAAPVDLAASDWRPDAADLADTLADLQQRLGFGRALAAPQIGSPWRLIAFNCALGRFVAVNPRLTWTSSETIVVEDDCFSVPDRKVHVRRAASVSFECHDQHGALRRFDWLAVAESELVQHEIDHLDGVLMTDRMVELIKTGG